MPHKRRLQIKSYF